MFRIGEFARIAQVSGRLLRYYDQIGLLSPLHTDSQTGYRYYSASQLPHLNRILALKELGLSLDQIRRLVDEDISADEIRGMLTLHKAQVEQQMIEAAGRIRTIESRLRAIEENPTPTRHDIVVKAVPEQEMLGLRVRLTLDDVTRLGERMVRALSARVDHRRLLGPFGAVMHNDFMDEEVVDVEMGYYITRPIIQPVSLDKYTLTIRQIPFVEMMATFVVVGPIEYSHLGYSAIGAWMEANRYQIAGPTREVMLQMPRRKNDHEAITEVQFPVQPQEPNQPKIKGESV